MKDNIEKSVEELTEKVKDTIKIVDRGAKTSLRDCQNEKSRWFKIVLIQSIAMIVLIIGSLTLFQSTKYFVVDKNSVVKKLDETENNFSLTETSVYSFVEDTVILTFGLSYNTYKDQLLRAKLRYDDKSFEKLKTELDRSNFIRLMVKYHRTYTIVPTPSVYRIVPVAPKVFDVYRSFMVESIGDDGVSRSEVIYVVRVGLVPRTARYYQGLKVFSIHQMDFDEYKNLEINLGSK